MNPTQSETPLSQSAKDAAEEFRQFRERAMVGWDHDSLAESVLQNLIQNAIERELASLKSPELTGDARVRIAEIVARWNSVHPRLKERHCVAECDMTSALTQLHAQHQREMAALREENERLKRWLHKAGEDIEREYAAQLEEDRRLAQSPEYTVHACDLKPPPPTNFQTPHYGEEY